MAHPYWWRSILTIIRKNRGLWIVSWSLCKTKALPVLWIYRHQTTSWSSEKFWPIFKRGWPRKGQKGSLKVKRRNYVSLSKSDQLMNQFPHDRFGFNRKIKETREANFSDQGGFFFRSSHDTLCADPPPLRIFFEGRGVCTQDIPMINAQFRHEYSTVFLSLAWFA